VSRGAMLHFKVIKCCISPLDRYVGYSRQSLVIHLPERIWFSRTRKQVPHPKLQLKPFQQQSNAIPSLIRCHYGGKYIIGTWPVSWAAQSLHKLAALSCITLGGLQGAPCFEINCCSPLSF